MKWSTGFILLAAFVSFVGCASTAPADEDIPPPPHWLPLYVQNFRTQWSSMVGPLNEEECAAILDSNTDGHVSFAEVTVGRMLLRRLIEATLRADQGGRSEDMVGRALLRRLVVTPLIAEQGEGSADLREAMRVANQWDERWNALSERIRRGLRDLPAEWAGENWN